MKYQLTGLGREGEPMTVEAVACKAKVRRNFVTNAISLYFDGDHRPKVTISLEDLRAIVAAEDSR